MYTMDKSLTYLARGKEKAKAITMKEAMVGGKEFVSGLYDAYQVAAEEILSNTRIELRVPWRFRIRALANIDTVLYCESMVSFSKLDWW
jgi:hypothetical protein